MDDTLFDARGKPRPSAVRAARAHLAAADAPFAQLLKDAGPFRLELSVLHDPYRALARAIVGQQISGHAARAIFERVRVALGGEVFPAPEVVVEATDERLRACGLSRMKALSLRDLAAKTLDGTVPTLRELRRLSDEAIIERLTEVRGIGVWTVQMMLMFRLGRADIMPGTDLGIRKGFARTFLRGRMPTPRQVEQRAKAWAPWRSVAAWYLWRAVELP